MKSFDKLNKLMENRESDRIRLREQAYNRLTLAAGNLMLMGAGLYVAEEGKPLLGSAVTVGAGTVGVLFSKLGISEYLESKPD